MSQRDRIQSLYSGVRNRSVMMAFGGFLFFGGYEQKKKFFFEEH